MNNLCDVNVYCFHISNIAIWPIYDRWPHLITSPHEFQRLFLMQRYISNGIQKKWLHFEWANVWWGKEIHICLFWIRWVDFDLPMWHRNRASGTLKGKKNKKPKQHLVHRVKTGWLDTECQYKCNFLQCLLQYKIHKRILLNSECRD